ncbi:hypothetical protein BS17DRAFT_171258 [Gyrodon lividus]|nr:hypothetical protein BS17DRAFT_171258 [Gyrodon lividus]
MGQEVQNQLLLDMFRRRSKLFVGCALLIWTAYFTRSTVIKDLLPQNGSIDLYGIFWGALADLEDLQSGCLSSYGTPGTSTMRSLAGENRNCIAARFDPGQVIIQIHPNWGLQVLNASCAW